MNYSTLSETDQTALTALWLATERASAGYLAARKDFLRLNWRAMSLRRLASEQPARTDYRAALTHVESAVADATERVDLAQAARDLAWQIYDAKWTATVGRQTASVAA
jgi:hypothetical protein